MNTDRRLRLWSQVVEHAQGAPAGVSHACAAVMSATGAAVTAVLGSGLRETVYASDQLASELEELTMTLGQGPGVDAFADGPALTADLTTPVCLARWPAFAPAAASAGAAAVFALPLRVGAIQVGVMDLYRAQPGGLDAERLLSGLACAVARHQASTQRSTNATTCA